MESYEFGPYRIDSGERLLHRGDELVSLPPKVSGTLLVLVQNAGRMVDKGDLMKAVWPDTFVEEGALTRNISLIRKTLGDTGPEAAYIETIPKRGYRFVASVRVVPICQHGGAAVETHDPQPVTPIPSAPVKRTRGTGILLIGALVATLGAIALYVLHDRSGFLPTPSITSGMALAVLPFRTIEKDTSQDYFADGLTQALISSLANLRKIRVVSLASDFGVAKDAAAWDVILRDRSIHRVFTGTVWRSEGRVRIDARLIDPATRAVYWANSYDRDAGSVLDLGAGLAESIANEIQVSVTAADKERLRRRVPVKPEALDAYMRGRYLWNRRTEESLRRAIEYFRQAIALDPGYAPAYSGLSDSYSILGSIGTDGMAPIEVMPLAKAAARKAIELEPDLADGHVSLAYVLLSYDWDLPGAAREFSRTLALNPDCATGRHWYSHYFMAAGNLPKATEQMREALQLEPLSHSINIGVGWCHYYSREYDAAIERFRSVVEMDPELPLAHQTLGMAYEQKGRLDLAIEEFQRAAAFSNNSPASVAALAGVYATTGRLAEARRELARLEEMSRTRYVPALYFASVHQSLGDLAKTFDWGWKAIGERCDYLLYLRVEPRAGKLTGNPEFIRAMAALHR